MSLVYVKQSPFKNYYFFFKISVNSYLKHLENFLNYFKNGLILSGFGKYSHCVGRFSFFKFIKVDEYIGDIEDISQYIS